MKVVNIMIGLALGLALGLGGGYVAWGADGGAETVAQNPGAGQFDREQMMNMSEEERQAFFEEQGIEAPAGGGMRGGGTMQGGSMPGGALTGTVLAVDPDSITIELEGGGSQTVYLDGDTTYAETTEAGTGLLVEGAQVQVSGTPEADGVFTAVNVVVSP